MSSCLGLVNKYTLKRDYLHFSDTISRNLVLRSSIAGHYIIVAFRSPAASIEELVFICLLAYSPMNPHTRAT